MYEFLFYSISFLDRKGRLQPSYNIMTTSYDHNDYYYMYILLLIKQRKKTKA